MHDIVQEFVLVGLLKLYLHRDRSPWVIEKLHIYRPINVNSDQVVPSCYES